MNKPCFRIVPILAFSTFSTISADNVPPLALQSQKEDTQKYVHADIGVDAFFARSTNSYYNYGDSKKVTYKGNHSFAGLYYEFDRLKPNSYYAGGTTSFAWGDSNQKVYLGHHKVEEINTSKDYWINADLGWGYNFQHEGLSSTLISVFAGPGSHGEGRWGHRTHWWYGMTGFKATQAFNNGLSIGAAFKTMYSFDVKDPRNVTTIERKGQGRFWGIEMALPISWHLGTERKFNLSLKPYLLKFNINSSETILGSRVEVGFSY